VLLAMIRHICQCSENVEASRNGSSCSVLEPPPADPWSGQWSIGDASPMIACICLCCSLLMTGHSSADSARMPVW